MLAEHVGEVVASKLSVRKVGNRLYIEALGSEKPDIEDVKKAAELVFGSNVRVSKLNSGGTLRYTVEAGELQIRVTCEPAYKGCYADVLLKDKPVASCRVVCKPLAKDADTRMLVRVAALLALAFKPKFDTKEWVVPIYSESQSTRISRSQNTSHQRQKSLRQGMSRRSRRIESERSAFGEILERYKPSIAEFVLIVVALLVVAATFIYAFEKSLDILKHMGIEQRFAFDTSLITAFLYMCMALPAPHGAGFGIGFTIGAEIAIKRLRSGGSNPCVMLIRELGPFLTIVPFIFWMIITMLFGFILLALFPHQLDSIEDVLLDALRQDPTFWFVYMPANVAAVAALAAVIGYRLANAAAEVENRELCEQEYRNLTNLIDRDC